MPDSARSALQTACAGTAPLAATPAQINAWVRAEPARALAAACANADIESALHAVDALLELSRTDAAHALLRALPAPDDVDPWRGHWLFVHGMAAGNAGQRPLAAQHLAAARAAQEEAGQRLSRRYARTLIGQGVMWRNAGELDRAEQAATDAQAVLAALGLTISLEAADLLNLRTVLAHSRQNLAQTVDYARAEIAMMERLGLADAAEVQHAWASLGATLSQMNRHEEALQALQQSLRLVELRPDGVPYGQLGIFQNLAQTYLSLGRAELALPLAERAIAKAAAAFGSDSPRQVRPLMLAAAAHWNAARYGAALLAYRRAQVLAERQRAALPPHTLLELADGIAAVQTQLGDWADARSTLQGALAPISGRSDFSYWRGRLLRRLALIDARQQRWADAEGRHAEAAELIGAVIGTAHPYVTEMHAERCVAQLRQLQQQPAEAPACADLHSALPALAGANAALRFRVHAALAQREQARADPAAAAEQHLAALAAATAYGGADPRWLALDALALHLRGQNQAALAIYFGKQAIAAIEQLRSEVAAAVAQAERGFLIDKTEVYRRVAEWLAEDGRIDEALDVLRLLKEEEFFDFVQRDDRLAGAAQRLEPNAAERRIEQRWQRLPDTSATAGDEAAWSARARELLRELASAAPAAPDGSDAAAQLPRLSVVARGELHVHAISGEQQLTLMFDSAGGRRAQRIAWPRAELGRAARRAEPARRRGRRAARPAPPPGRADRRGRAHQRCKPHRAAAGRRVALFAAGRAARRACLPEPAFRARAPRGGGRALPPDAFECACRAG